MHRKTSQILVASAILSQMIDKHQLVSSRRLRTILLLTFLTHTPAAWCAAKLEELTKISLADLVYRRCIFWHVFYDFTIQHRTQDNNLHRSLTASLFPRLLSLFHQNVTPNSIIESKYH